MTRIALAAALLALAAGCSSTPERPEVTGKVTFQGKPIEEGLVTFHGPDGKQATGSIRPDGGYTVADPPLGVCQITLSGTPGNTGKAGGDGHSAVPGAGQRPSLIPKKYAKPGNGLSHDVKPGPQTCDLPLTP
jgi:hypothetical protein